MYKGDGVDFQGNQGLKDQQMALQWVQDNIGSFGGDKSQVNHLGCGPSEWPRTQLKMRILTVTLKRDSQT